jgi:cbb3-type cytochrome oxidase subunit 3
MPQDSVAYGLSNIVHHNGWNISISGIFVVFMGLILIALTIWIFNKLMVKETQQSTETIIPFNAKKIISGSKDIPNEHTAAISAAIELYRRLHFDALQSKVTFNRGETHSPWKTGSRFGQRKPMR